MLDRFPMIGKEFGREGTQVLLRLRTRRAPFYVWYLYDTAGGRDGLVTLLRLFHTKQQTPAPRFR